MSYLNVEIKARFPTLLLYEITCWTIMLNSKERMNNSTPISMFPTGGSSFVKEKLKIT